MRSDQLYFFGTEKNGQLIYNLNFIGLNCKSLKKKYQCINNFNYTNRNIGIALG